MKAFLRWLAMLFAASLAMACASAAPEPESQNGPKHVLVFTHSTGYRHASIEPGVALIRAIGEREGWTVDDTADPDVFSAERLAHYDAIVFMSTTSSRRNPDSEWLQGARRDALQAFVHRGGGIVGIHAAADSHYNWPWYRQMIGAAFRIHPPGEPPAAVTITDSNHPATRGLPTSLTRADEWYYYDDVSPNIRLLATYDPVSFGQPGPGPNPISWSQEFEGGRVFYTGMGHVVESYSEDFFIRHVTGGLRYVLRLED